MLRAVSARRPPAPAARSRPLARPRIGPYRVARFIALAIALSGFGFSCASQSPPLPPRIERPQQVTDLAVTQQGRAFVLRFSPPVNATDGERLTKPLTIEIFRAIAPPGAPVSVPQPAGAPSATLGPDEIRRLTNDKELKYDWNLPPQEYSSTLGSNYAFAVRGMTLGFRKRSIESAFSNVAQARLLDVSEPVADLHAQATQNAIELIWSPVQKGLTGGTLQAFSGYRVYRSESGKPNSFAILAEPPSPSYSDAAFKFDHSYYYIVMALFKSGSTVAVSGGSKTVEITPHDTFPPTVPSDVTGIYTANAVDIVWTPSPEPDLAGYNVYRRTVGGVETKVNGQLVRTPVFRDPNVQAGQIYFYRVTALDQAGNESAPSTEIEVDTR